MKRRDFLQTGALAGAGTLALASSTSMSAEQTAAELKKQNKPKKRFSTDPLAVVPLTEKVSCTRLGFGTGMNGYNRQSNLTRQGEEKAVELLKYAYDKGIRLFDMADLYGTHSFVAKALAGKPRDSYTLVTKIWLHDGGLPEKERPDADETLKRFLKECNTDYLDVVQIHCMMDDQWNSRFQHQMEILERLKKEGVIRAHGVSCHANSALETAAKTQWVDTVHVRINHEGAKMDGAVNGVVKVAQACHDSGIGVIGMKVIGEGTFRENLEKRQTSAEFVMGLDCVDVIVVGFTEKGHIDELIDNVRVALEKISANKKREIFLGGSTKFLNFP
ncbi:MAG: aldo/keto reductase [Planctomycetaceae bacterium]|jgi:aryl-alcohol dehydrogenase-like predicted oxidoreductase|nr:aldo/keto reductase [Planctomycetaceae bacterium]